MRDIVRLLDSRHPERLAVKEARAVWGAFRIKHHLDPGGRLLTPPNGNLKYIKTEQVTYGLSLAPAKSSGTINVCRYSTPECRKGCVAFSGRGKATRSIKGRQVRTWFLAEHPDAFVTILDHEVTLAERKYLGEKIGVRLNGFSDIPWERLIPWLFENHPNVAFYDYTKVPFGLRELPSNYHLTYSVSERTEEVDLHDTILAGENVAVVFSTKKGEDLPKTWQGLRVVDGDKSDARYLDPKGVIVGLRAKGDMKRTKGNFKMVKEAA